MMKMNRAPGHRARTLAAPWTSMSSSTSPPLVMDNDYLVLSALPPEAVAGRVEGEDSGEEE